jgi:hypothetical protein
MSNDSYAVFALNQTLVGAGGSAAAAVLMGVPWTARTVVAVTGSCAVQALSYAVLFTDASNYEEQGQTTLPGIKYAIEKSLVGEALVLSGVGTGVLYLTGFPVMPAAVLATSSAAAMTYYFGSLLLAAF